MTPDSPPSASPTGTAWRSLALLAGCFLLSCGVVAGVLVNEFAHYSKSNSGIMTASFVLLDGRLLLGGVGVLGLLFAKHFRHASAVFLGLLPVLLLAGLLHGVEGWGPVLAPKPGPPPIAPSPPEPPAIPERIDSARVYTFVEQMPALTTGGGPVAIWEVLAHHAGAHHAERSEASLL